MATPAQALEQRITFAQNALISKLIDFPDGKIPVEYMESVISEVSNQIGVSAEVVESVGMSADVFPSRAEIEIFRQRKKEDKTMVNKANLRSFQSLGIETASTKRLEYELPFAYLDPVSGVYIARSDVDEALKSLKAAGFQVNEKAVNRDIMSLRVVWRYFSGSKKDKDVLMSQIEGGQPQSWLLKAVLDAGVKSWGELNLNISSRPTEHPQTRKQKQPVTKQAVAKKQTPQRTETKGENNLSLSDAIKKIEDDIAQKQKDLEILLAASEVLKRRGHI